MDFRKGSYEEKERKEKEVEELSKQAYFRWKEQEELKKAKEAEERAKQFYFSKWQQQEFCRRAEERKQKLDEAHRREEERRRQEEEDRKMPASTPEKEKQVQEDIKAYIAKWQEAKPSERLVLQVKDQAMLEQLEALKKNTKRMCRKHTMGVEMPDADPWVWSQSFQGQRATKTQLNELRLMRSQLIETLQPTEAVLRKAGIDVACNESQEKVYYSSDEEESPFPPRSKANHKKATKPVFQAHEVKQMQISQKGVNAITSHEGFRKKEYRVEGRGNKTIGYGHEKLPGENFSQGITKEQALDLLDKYVQKALEKVQKYVKVPLKQHQLDALVSYVYNTGSLYDTRLLEKLNAKDFAGAAREMDIVTQKGSGGKVLPGLVNRREAERKLFLYGYDH